MGRKAMGRMFPLLVALSALLSALPAPLAAAAPPPTRAPILITGDADLNTANGVVAGAGTAENPFVIEGWQINASGGFAIEIENTTRPLIVRRVELLGDLSSASGGLQLVNASGVTVEGLKTNGTATPVLVFQSANISLSNLSFERASSGLRILGSKDITADHCTAPPGVWAGVDVEVSERVIVSDCAAADASGPGISVYRSTAVVLRNNTLDRNWVGVRANLEAGQSVRLENNTVSASVTQGVVVEPLGYATTGGAELFSNTISGSGELGLSMWGYTCATIVGNTFEGNGGDGAHLFLGSNYTFVEGNRFVGNLNDGLSLYSVQSPVVEGNLFEDSGSAGLLISYTAGAHISGNLFTRDIMDFEWDNRSQLPAFVGTDNLVNGLPLLYVADRDSVRIDGVRVGMAWIVNCTDAQLTNLTFYERGGGIFAALVNALEVSHNGFVKNSSGIRVSRVGNLTANGNWFDGGSSISFRAAGNVSAEGNRASGASGIRGTVLDDGSAVVVGNHLTDVQGDGLFLLSDSGWPFNARVESNLLLGGSGNGMLLSAVWNTLVSLNTVQAFGTGAVIDNRQNVSIFHNNFLSLGTAGASNSYARWTMDYPVGGNYWSNLEAPDACSGPNQDSCQGGDGILEGYQRLGGLDGGYPGDYMPLATPVAFPLRGPTAAAAAFPEVAGVGELFALDASPSFDLNEGAPPQVRWDFDADGIWDTPFQSNTPVTRVFAGFGEHLVRFEVQDAEGNADSASVVVRVADLSPPELAVTAPTAGVRFGIAAVNVTGTASDAGGGLLSRVEVRVNGGPWFTATGLESWRAEVALVPGTNEIEARAVDGVGHVSPVRTLLLGFDPPPPPEPSNGTENGTTEENNTTTHIPETSIFPLPAAQAMSSREIGITATVVAPAGASVILHWRTSGATGWNDAPMVSLGQGNFTAVIPDQPAGSTVEYYFTVEEGGTTLARSPTTGSVSVEVHSPATAPPAPAEAAIDPIVAVGLAVAAAGSAASLVLLFRKRRGPP